MTHLSDISATLDSQLGQAATADPLETLARITWLRALLAAREREAVRAAVTRHSWSEIGRALGVSKQAAFSRFGKQWITEIKGTMTISELKNEVRHRLR